MFDVIYMCMGVSDNFVMGLLIFFEEMFEALNILEMCTSRSFVIMDEFG